MQRKTLIIVFGMLLIISLAGIATANNITNLAGIDMPVNVISGNTFQANFSFDYFDILENEDGSPLIIRLNVTSEKQGEYPVLKGDFEIKGMIEKCSYTLLGTCILPERISFNCSERAPLWINHSIGHEFIESIPDGIFYCYNEEADLNLNEHNDVLLNVRSHIALRPGEYNLTARLFYLSDTYPPVVTITNKNEFDDRYYRELDNIEVQAKIYDNVGLSEKWGRIFTPWQNITVPFSHKSAGIDYFTKTLPSTIQEGNYDLVIYAEDQEGNRGSDNTTLKIDRTGPTIIANKPTGDVYVNTIPIELNVSDWKSGVDTGKVYYRLREMNGSTLCPGSGIGTWDCYNSGWVQIPLNETGFYDGKINATESGLESGEYWFEAKAEDLLGNGGILE